MTDLKARIGPKVAPGHFPNQSWVRPGYEAKPSARRSPWQEERHGTQLHDSTTTNDLDFSPSQPQIPSTSSRPERSLFARMGIDDDARELPETEHVAKSLIERLEDFPSPAAALGSQRQPIDVDALDEEYDAGQRLLNEGEPTVSVKSEPIEVDIAFDDERAIAASICEPVIDVSHAAHSPENLMGGASFKNKLPTKNLRTEELESYNDLAPGVSFIEKGSLGYGAGPPLPPRNQPDSDMSTTNHALLRPTSPGRKDSPGSGSEEGEVHEAFTEQVRGSVLPLMQRIAGQRLMDSGLESSAGPTHMNTSVITNEVSASFIRHAKNVASEVGFHDSTLSSEDMRRSPVLSPVAKAPAPNAGQAGLRQEDTLRRLSSRNANNSFSSPEALSPPLTSRSMRGDYAQHSPPQAPPKERDSSPRYTPSPYKYQQSHNRGSTSIQTSPTISEPGRKRQRSPSLDGYHTRRRAYSRGQPYATRPVRGREVHSPDTDSRRQFRKPHEYHSPPPDSKSHIVGREIHSPEADQRRNSKHDSNQLGYDQGRYRAPNGRPHSVDRHESRPFHQRTRHHHSRSPPPRKYFHDQDMQNSPEPTSPRALHSSYHSPRHSDGGQGKNFASRHQLSQSISSQQSNDRQNEIPRSFSPHSPSHTTTTPYVERREHESPARDGHLQISSSKFTSGHQSPVSPSSRSVQSPFSGENYNGFHEEYSQDSQNNELLPGPPSKEEEHTHMPLHLPCYNVPGLWFVKSALDDLGTLACDFEVDYETAQKWHIPLLHSDGSELHSNQQSQKNLSLQICAFSRQLVDGVMQNLGSEITPQEVAQTIFALPQSWPPAGHLIITVNPETPYAKTWLPYEFGPNQNPVQIEDHVSEGHNVVQFLQLSGMPDSIFALFAAEKEPDPDVPMETVPLLPSQTTGVASSENVIGVKAGTVTISS